MENCFLFKVVFRYHKRCATLACGSEAKKREEEVGGSGVCDKL